MHIPKVLTGLIIREHAIKDADSKARASKSLVGWQQIAQSPEAWVTELSKGHTIQPSAFSPNPDGTFNHTKDLWQSTHLVCADADNIKGVELDKDGIDLNPDGVPSFVDPQGLSKLYPELLDTVYAAGQSVSSMTEDKGAPHRRYRLIFLFDKPIISVEHFESILLALAERFPIIHAITRSPSQPVFGNARENFSHVAICGNILSLEDFPVPETPAEVETPIEKVSPSPSVSSEHTKPDETLEAFLQRHAVAYIPTGEPNKFWVTCPNEAGHASGKNKKEDAFVKEPVGEGWLFHCSHTTCQKKGFSTWDAFKRGYNIETKPAPRSSSPQSESDEDCPFFSGNKFLPVGMVNYLEKLDIHVMSLQHEGFVRVYCGGIYQQEQGEILQAMVLVLGERSFKMSQYNEVMDYLQNRVTRSEDCRHPRYLNVKNGFLNLDDYTLEPHTPDRKSIIQLPVKFDNEADPKKIDAWLSDCLEGDAEQMKLFYEAVGYSLLQTTELQKMFFLLGRTQTGKSTAMHIVKGLLGEDNFSPVELAPLEDETNRFARAQLYGKIVNFSCDISSKYLTGDGNVKKIIAGDPISGEYKFRPAFTFEPDCTLWAMANTLPGSGDKSGAWYEKMVILRFEKQFLSTGENKPDRTLKRTLTTPSELSGLLNVALACGKNALARGHFTHSLVSQETLQEYVILNDTALQFLNDIPDLDEWDDEEFLNTYRAWCEDEKVKPLSKVKLANATARHGCRRIRREVEGKRFFVWRKV